MIKTISVVYRGGVFVPLTDLEDLNEETTVEINMQIPALQTLPKRNEVGFSLEDNLRILYATSGILHSTLSTDEVQYLVESLELAQENFAPSLD